MKADKTNTEESTVIDNDNGGQVASRGFRMQALACLLDDMFGPADPGVAIWLEPTDVANIVDYRIEGSNGLVVHVQVKHSRNRWKPSEMRQWLSELAADTSAARKKLLLVGSEPACMAEMRKEFPSVELPIPIPLNEAILHRALADKIHEFMDSKKMGSPGYVSLFMLAHTLVDVVFEKGTLGRRLQGAEVEVILRQAITAKCGVAGSHQDELQEISNFRAVFGFDAPRFERDAILAFFAANERAIRPWQLRDAKDFLDCSSGSVRVRFRMGPMYMAFLGGVAILGTGLLCICCPILVWSRFADKPALVIGAFGGAMILSFPFLLMVRPFINALKIKARVATSSPLLPE